MIYLQMGHLRIPWTSFLLVKFIYNNLWNVKGFPDTFEELHNLRLRFRVLRPLPGKQKTKSIVSILIKVSVD